MAEGEVIDNERVFNGATLESRGKPKRRLKTMIIGVGAILIVIGIALAIYIATQEGGPFLFALAPAFIGVIVIIAALSGKKL